MTPSPTLLDELSNLTERFTEAWKDTHDKTTGIIAASLSAVLGAIYGNQLDLLGKFGTDLAHAGLAELRR